MRELRFSRMLSNEEKSANGCLLRCAELSRMIQRKCSSTLTIMLGRIYHRFLVEGYILVLEIYSTLKDLYIIARVRIGWHETRKSWQDYRNLFPSTLADSATVNTHSPDGVSCPLICRAFAKCEPVIDMWDSSIRIHEQPQFQWNKLKFNLRS